MLPPNSPQSATSSQATRSSLMEPPSHKISSLDAIPQDWPDFLQIQKETEDAIRWKELTSLMDHETPKKLICSAVYSISLNPKQSLSRIAGLLSSSSADIKVKTQMLLDCGCSTNLMGATTAQRLHRLHDLENADNIRLFNASGE